MPTIYKFKTFESENSGTDIREVLYAVSKRREDMKRVHEVASYVMVELEELVQLVTSPSIDRPLIALPPKVMEVIP